MNLEQYRKEFPFAESCVYLDHASQGPFPLRTVEAIRRAIEKRANPTLFSHEDSFETPRLARRLAARLIGAEAEQIALIHSTGDGINMAASGLELGEGDTVIVADKEFPSNVYPWLNLERRGVTVRFVGGDHGCFDIERFERAIDSRTRVLAISFVQFFNGYRNDLDALTHICREHGIRLFVDGSQGVGALALDVRRTPIDMMACCGPKWLLSPMGAGFFYVSQDLLHIIRPSSVGWLSFLQDESDAAFDHLTDYVFELPLEARKFEVGSPLHLPLAGFCPSLELILEVGIEDIERHIMELLDHFLSFLQGSRFTILSSLEARHRSSILSFTSDDIQAVHRHLKANNVHTSVREGGLRVSPHFYNTLDDIDRLITLLKMA